MSVNTHPLYATLYFNENRAKMKYKNPSDDKFEIARKLEICWEFLSYKTQQKYKENLLPLNGYAIFCSQNIERIRANNPTNDYNEINRKLDACWLILTNEEKLEYNNVKMFLY